MKLLVCGGRNFGRIPPNTVSETMGIALSRAEREQELLTEILDNLFNEQGIQMIIHGAARGADELAEAWAIRHSIRIKRFPAQWTKYGRLAGHLRNKQMLEQSKPDLVLAFPGGRGTADCVAQAEKAGILIMRVEGEKDEK